MDAEIIAAALRYYIHALEAQAFHEHAGMAPEVEATEAKLERAKVALASIGGTGAQDEVPGGR